MKIELNGIVKTIAVGRKSYEYSWRRVKIWAGVQFWSWVGWSNRSYGGSCRGIFWVEQRGSSFRGARGVYELSEGVFVGDC